MNRIIKYSIVSLLSLSLFSSCKYIGTSEPPNMEKIDEQRNKRETDPVREKILNVVYIDFGNAVLDLLTHGNINWFIDNGFFDPNLKGEKGEDLRLEKCIFALELYPIWARLSEENKVKFHPIIATAFLDDNPQSTLFKWDRYALSHLEDFVIVNLQDVFDENQKNNELYPLILKKNSQGGYEVYNNPGMKRFYNELILSFIREDRIMKDKLRLLQPTLCKDI